MKPALTAALALSASSLAFAQSNVTLSGALDLYLAHAKTGSSSWAKLQDGGRTASNITVRGREDLGGGVSAYFLLEAGVSPDTGEGTLPGPSLAFTRQSYMGLSGPWGQIDLGRIYTPLFTTLFRGDPYGVNSVFSPLLLAFQVDAQSGLLGLAARTSNTIRYRTPAKMPFFADIAYAPGEATKTEGASGSGDIYSAAFGWSSKPYFVAYAIQRSRSGTAAAPVASPSTTTHQTISGAYDFNNNLQLYATYTVASASGVALSGIGVPRSRTASLGASYAVTPNSNLLLEAVQRKVSRTDRAQFAWTLGYDYNLSRRTSLYGRFLNLENRGDASVSLAGVRVAPNSGDEARVIAAGIRHTF
ncbi:MAG: porin [Rubrivivax sp.]